MEPTRTRTSPLPVRQDSLATNAGTTDFFGHLRNNRTLVIQMAIVIVVVVLIGAAIAVVYSVRANAANAALAEAMQTLDTPVSTPEQPVPPSVKSFASLQDRARAANGQFAAIAGKYGMTPAGRNAQYLQGVTALETGDKAGAETILKKSAGDWNHDVATLAQLALAGLYHSTNRDALAIETYQKVADKPSTLVPAGLARLQLAELYESNGKTADAKKVYAQIKDKEPKSAAGEIASQKLTGAPAQ
ncbi:MAG: tetratricopeptide repeat protein [Janthinobacterium lividum]